MGQCLTSTPESPPPSTPSTQSKTESAEEKVSLTTKISRAEQETQGLRDIIARNGNSQEGNIAICTEWSGQWISYSKGETSTIPGKIDNSSLDGGNGKTKLSTCDTGNLKGDFFSVNEEIWDYFCQIYGGGPKLIAISKKQYKWYNFETINNNKNECVIFITTPIWLSKSFSNMDINEFINYKIGDWNYKATKLNDGCIIQQNLDTNKIRYFDRVGEELGSRIADNKEETDNECDVDIKSNNNNTDNDIYFGEYKEYEEEKLLFESTMSIKKYQITKINKINCDKNTLIANEIYPRALQFVSRKHKYSIDNNKLERKLYHGTDWDTTNKIIKNGFNRDFNKRAKYGKGVYFAKNASYSHEYASLNKENEYCLLSCDVIVGQYKKGENNMTQPQLMSSDNITHYDSLVDNKQNPSIFVIGKDYHCIPRYQIIYKKI